jgi:MFS family permease
VSGVTNAVNAGEALPLPVRRLPRELPAYLAVQISWFSAFGIQMVAFPYILVNVLGVSGAQLGLAQMALAAPSVIFILLGGVVAERTDGRSLLVLFHGLAAVPAIGLAVAASEDRLVYWMMTVYAVAMGVIGAFMMPARDSILNDIVDRRRRAGSDMTLQQGVALATLAQFAAQIIGLTLGGLASRIGAAPILALQAAVVACGAAASLFIARGRTVASGRKGPKSIAADIAEGMACVRADPILLTMIASMFGVGLFVIGAFLVVLPIVNHDVYGQDSGGLRNVFVTFWAGAFCSSLAISRIRRIERPGRLLLLAQLAGSVGILFLARGAPYGLFLALVFVWGLAAGVSIMMSRSIVQAAAPSALLARVLSLYQLGFMAGAPVGAALLGILADAAGPALVMTVPALGMIAIVIWMIARTPIWRMTAPES